MYDTCQDFTGRKGTLRAGDLQWMTAGRGIVHSEMPGEDMAHGLQLWVNLAAKDKMVAPEYQEHTKEEIPSAERDGITVKGTLIFRKVTKSQINDDP